MDHVVDYDISLWENLILFISYESRFKRTVDILYDILFDELNWFAKNYRISMDELSVDH